MDVKCFSFALDGDDAGLLLGGEESVQRGEIGGGWLFRVSSVSPASMPARSARLWSMTAST